MKRLLSRIRMLRYRATIQHTAILLFVLVQNVALLSVLPLIGVPGLGIRSAQAQEVERKDPSWWFGVAGAANLNYYRGTTQVLTSALTTPAPFHRGDGTGFYAGGLLEYRPNRTLGGMLNIGYDDRRGSFDTAMNACNCPGELAVDLVYLTVTPSLRLSPFSNGFYLFAGPRFAYNLSNAFVSRQAGTPSVTTEGDFSETRDFVISGEVGTGYDISLNSHNAATRVVISPFVSFHPYYGQDPRPTESWNITTFRVGAALKFGHGKTIPQVAYVPPVIPPVAAPDVTFSIRAPLAVPVLQRVRETFPLLNHVFFDAGKNSISNRYVLLTSSEASAFSEAQLQNVEPVSTDGRPGRQMDVYYNVLNILGDRMRANPEANVTLVGSTGGSTAEGKALADTVKNYVVDRFGINATRITTTGRIKPANPSEVPGSTLDLVRKREEDRRVEIQSSSPVMLIEVGGPPNVLRPVQIVGLQENPLDGHAIFTVVGAEDVLTSWSLDIKDDISRVRHFGPFTDEQTSIPGKTILGSSKQGTYSVVMTGQTKNGSTITKNGTVRLTLREEAQPEIVRFSVLFDFDRSKTVANYDTFLREKVAPLIPAGSKVIIHGHSDTIGETGYNSRLSASRANEAQRILKDALSKRGTGSVTFETFGFGEETRLAPFNNSLPEGRFYYRTVIIDILPAR